MAKVLFFPQLYNEDLIDLFDCNRDAVSLKFFSNFCILRCYIYTVFHAKRVECAIFHLLWAYYMLDPHMTYHQDPQSLVIILIPMIRCHMTLM